MSMPNTPYNKFRAAVEVLQRGRDTMVEGLADEILDQSDDFLDSGFMFNEFLETQGTRMHFLTLLLSQLEMSAEMLDERLASEPPPPTERKVSSTQTASKKRKPRRKKVDDKASPEGSPEEA